MNNYQLKIKYSYPDERDKITRKFIESEEPYCNYWQQSENHLFDFIEKIFKNRKQDRLLDLGCGEGRSILKLARFFDQVIALDPDKKRIMRAKKRTRIKKVKFINRTFLSQNFPKGYFKAVFCHQVISHIKTSELPAFFQKIYNILEDGGILVLTAAHSGNSRDTYLKTFLKENKNAGMKINKEEFNNLVINRQNILPIHLFSIKNLKHYLKNFNLKYCKLYHVLYNKTFLDKIIFRDFLINLLSLKKLARDVCIIAEKKIVFNNNKTFCPLLWSSVFVNQAGEIYTCCHQKPGLIGNIYRGSLSSIWKKSLALKRFRWQALHGCLSCFKACNILSQEEKRNFEQKNQPSLSPRRIWLQYTEFCNQCCIMCPQNHKSRISLENKILQKNIDWKKIKEIELQGGEVLALPEAKRFYLWLTQKMNKKVNLITNGMLLNDQWAKYLVKGSNWIQISVNAACAKTHELVNRGSKFNRVMVNIKKLVQYRRRLGSKVEIIYKYTLVPENIREMAKAILFANQLGCDSIQYGYDRLIPLFLAKKPKLRLRLKKEIAKMITEEDLALKIYRGGLEYLGLVDKKIKQNERFKSLNLVQI